MVDLSVIGIQPGTGWQVIGMLATVAFIFVIGIAVLIVMAFMIILMIHRKKAICYKVYGGKDVVRIVNDTDVMQIGDKTIQDPAGKKIDDTNQLANVTLSLPEIKRGAFVNQNGMLKMRFMFPLGKKTQVIQSDMIYPEGVYFLQIGNEYFPIRRPQVEITKQILIDLKDISGWKEWDHFETERIARRFPEKDVQMRIFILFIVAVVGIVALTGFVLWMSFHNTGQIIGKIDMLGNFIDGAVTKVSGGVPG